MAIVCTTPTLQLGDRFSLFCCTSSDKTMVLLVLDKTLFLHSIAAGVQDHLSNLCDRQLF